MEQVDHRQCAIGHAGQDLQRVAIMQADVAEPLFLDLDQRLRDSVDERLGADEAVVG